MVLQLLSMPADFIGVTLLVVGGRIMSRFLADAMSMPEANLPSVPLTKHEQCEHGDSKSLTSAPWDCRHGGMLLNVERNYNWYIPVL